MIHETQTQTTALIPFEYNSQPVRVVQDENGEPWWVAKDVCAILGISNHRTTLATVLYDDEKGVHKVDTPGGIQKLRTVNGSGLFALIFRSRKPDAKRFRKWITSEVIPSLRRNGYYTMPNLEIDHSPLRVAILNYRESFGRGADADISKTTGVDPNIISRIARGTTRTPSAETWSALYRARPDIIPAPPWVDSRAAKPQDFPEPAHAHGISAADRRRAASLIEKAAEAQRESARLCVEAADLLRSRGVHKTDTPFNQSELFDNHPTIDSNGVMTGAPGSIPMPPGSPYRSYHEWAARKGYSSSTAQRVMAEYRANPNKVQTGPVGRRLLADIKAELLH